MSDQWTVTCEIDADRSDVASLFLFDSEATAVSETTLKTPNNGAVQLRAGFQSEAHARHAVETITARLPGATCEAFVDATQHDWVDAQRNALSPTTIAGFTVRAPWHPPSAQPERGIIIDPGAAFGHGAHESTQLAAELSQRAIQPGDTVVDLGTGTGVLAILAAKAGATVRAVEVDPIAAEVAASNFAANAVTSQIELITSDASEAAISPSDLVIANVTLDVHRHIAPSYSAATRIITAGILCNQVAALNQLLVDHTPKTVRTLSEWAGVSYVSAALSEASGGR